MCVHACGVYTVHMSLLKRSGLFKQNCRVKANFGTRPFAYAEGQQHRDAAEAANDVMRDIRESFGHLPFHCISDSDSDGNETGAGGSVLDSRDSCTPPRAPCKRAVAPSALKGLAALLCAPAQCQL